MQISSLLDIVDGKLLNSPSISFIYSIKTSAKKVKEGDLFIAKISEEIPFAIANGAFAVIIEDNHIITDNEIAWIKVENIDTSIIKLIRFKLSIKNLKAYYCGKITYNILKIYSNYLDKNTKLIPNKLENIFKYLDDIENDFILISSNKDILEKIYPNNYAFENNINLNDIKNLIEHSLFETSFSYKDNYFSRLKISSLYIFNFIQVFNFLKADLDSSKLKSFHNMKPLFLDKNLNLVEFGKSEKFIICQNDKILYKNEILYVKMKYTYAKILVVSSYYLDFLDKEEQIIINEIEELKPTLKKVKFNCIYLVGFNYNELYDYLLKEELTKSLF